MTKEEYPRTTFLIMLAIVYISFGVLTFLHDPILHCIPALLFGWDIVSWETGILTGNVIVNTINATTWELWWYYMTPPLVLCTGALTMVILYPSRFTGIPSFILFMLNIASMDFNIGGSDSNKALLALLEHGVNPLPAHILHYALFIGVIFVFGTVFFVIFENNIKDAMYRRDKLLFLKR